MSIHALRDAGLEVSGAANGEQALEMLTARTFDVMISDVVMPGISGTELAQRARQRNPRAKVLLVSGYAGEFTLDHEAILPKPYTPEGLVARVQRLLEEP